MATQTSAGTELAVSASIPATFDAAGYGAETYTKVGEIENLGDFGREYSLVTYQSLDDRASRKKKGSYNNGQFTPRIAIDSADAGQGILETALDSDAKIAIRVTLQDGTIYYMAGLVMTFRPSVGTTDDIVVANAQIEITEDAIVKV